MATNDTKAKIVLSAKDKASKKIEKANSSFVKLVAGVTAGNIAASAASKALGLLSDSVGQLVQATKVAARIQVLNRVFFMTGQNAGHTATQLEEMKFNVMDLGIAEQEALQIGQRFIQAQLDIADATKVARAAQDLAVIAGTNSSETALRLTDAIVKQRPILLKQFGIIANLNDIYGRQARQLGKSVEAMNETEKRAAFLNEILRQSKTVAGAYESAMKDVGKQMTSLPRHMQNAQNAVGKLFLPAMKVAVAGSKDFLVAVKNIADALNNDLDDAFTSMRRNASRLKRVTKNVKDLERQYLALVKITKPTVEQQAQLKQVTDDLAKIMPTAVTEWDKYGKAVSISADGIKRFLENSQALAKAEFIKNIKTLRADFEALTGPAFLGGRSFDPKAAAESLALIGQRLSELRKEEREFQESNTGFQSLLPSTRQTEIRQLASAFKSQKENLTAFNEEFNDYVAFANQAFPKLIAGTEEYSQAQILLRADLFEALLADQARVAANIESQTVLQQALAAYGDGISGVNEAQALWRENSNQRWLAENASIKSVEEDLTELATRRKIDAKIQADQTKKTSKTVAKAIAFRKSKMTELFDRMRDQNKQAAQNAAELQRAMETALKRGVDNMVDRLWDGQRRFAEVFKEMARSFLKFFVKKAIFALASKFLPGIGGIFGAITGAGPGGFLGTAGGGSGGLSAPSFGAGVDFSLGSAPAPGPVGGGQQPTGITVQFNGPVTSTAFVLDTIMPALENLIDASSGALVINRSNLTGADDAILI